MRNSTTIFNNEHIKQHVEGCRIKMKSLPNVAVNRSQEKEKEFSTPFTIFRKSVQSQRALIEKKKDSNPQMNLLLMKETINPGGSVDVIERHNKEKDKAIILNSQKSDKNLHHVYKIGETLLKDNIRNRTVRDSLDRFVLKNTIEEFLPVIGGHYFTIKGQPASTSPKVSKAQNTDKGYFRLYQIK